MVHGWPTLSSSVDGIFLLIAVISLVLLVGVTGVMIWFSIRYSRKRNPHAENIEGNLLLEILWTALPTVLVLAIFFVGWKGFVYQRTVPKDAMLIKVTARMWSWHFTYENGAEDVVLHVPVQKPVKLAITSADVLHSLFIPAFRVKEDAVPGMETYLWFRPERTGTYDLFCSEYCGAGHSSMISSVKVISEEEFTEWLTKNAPANATETKGKTSRPDGAKLFQDKGCFACHSLDGSPRVGPTLKALFGHEITVETNGTERKIVADDAYLRKSVLDPPADVVKGFPAIMPSQKGVLTEDEISALIEFLKMQK